MERGILYTSILFILMILLSGISSIRDVEAVTCHVPSGLPDVSTALSMGCTTIVFDGDVNEPGTVSILNSNNILIKGNGYRWIFGSGEIDITNSYKVTVKNVEIIRTPIINSPIIRIVRSDEVVFLDTNIPVNTDGWNPSISVFNSNISYNGGHLTDTGPSPRAIFYLYNVTGSLNNLVLNGAFYSIEVIDPVVNTKYKSLNITDVIASSLHFGIVLRDFGSNNMDIFINNTQISNQLYQAIWGQINNVHTPLQYTRIVVRNSIMANNVYDNIALYLQGQSNIFLTFDNVVFVDSDLYTNLALLASGFSNSHIAISRVNIIEDSDLPNNNILLYSDSGSYMNVSISNVALGPSDYANLLSVLYGASQMDISIKNSKFRNAGSFNVNIYQEGFSSSNILIKDSNLSSSGDTNLIFFNRHNSQVYSYVEDVHLSQAVNQNIYLGARDNAMQRVTVDKALMDNAGWVNIKAVSTSTASPLYIFRGVNTSNAIWSLEYIPFWSTATMKFYASILDRFWSHGWPPSIGSLILNQTIYDELSSQNDYVHVESWWILEVGIYSSYTFSPLENIPISILDGGSPISTVYTSPSGRAQYIFHYLYDESNPLIDQLTLYISTSYNSFSYGVYTDGGYTTTLPNIFIKLRFYIALIALDVLGYVNHEPMRMSISGDSGKIYIFNTVGDALRGIYSVKVIRFRVSNVAVVDDYILMDIAIITGYGYTSHQKLIFNRLTGILFSDGPYKIMGYRI